MDASTQIIAQEKRHEASAGIEIQFTCQKGNTMYYNVNNEDGKTRYLGRIEKTKSLSEYCTCPDFLYRNNESYQDEHGFALQCKHIIAAKNSRGWNL